MRAQQGFVAGATRHHNLDRALFRVGVVPIRAQFDDGIVELHANLAAHGHDHGFAGLGAVAGFKVLDQVGGDLGNARLRAHQFFQRGPAAFQLGLFVFFFVFGQLVDFIIDIR